MLCIFEIETIEDTIDNEPRERLTEYTFSVDCDCPPSIGDTVIHFFEKDKIEIRAKVVYRRFHTRIPYKTCFPSNNIPTFYIGLKVWEMVDCNHD